MLWFGGRAREEKSQEQSNPNILASHFKATSEQFWAGQYLPTHLSQYYFHAT